jgi:hypothetical protein
MWVYVLVIVLVGRRVFYWGCVWFLIVSEKVENGFGASWLTLVSLCDSLVQSFMRSARASNQRWGFWRDHEIQMSAWLEIGDVDSHAWMHDDSTTCLPACNID